MSHDERDTSVWVPWRRRDDRFVINVYVCAITRSLTSGTIDITRAWSQTRACTDVDTYNGCIRIAFNDKRSRLILFVQYEGREIECYISLRIEQPHLPLNRDTDLSVETFAKALPRYYPSREIDRFLKPLVVTEE